jgi:hypothetical protein
VLLQLLVLVAGFAGFLVPAGPAVACRSDTVEGPRGLVHDVVKKAEQSELRRGSNGAQREQDRDRVRSGSFVSGGPGSEGSSTIVSNVLALGR